MDFDDDLDRIALQEDRLRFTAFDEQTAWELGTRLRDRAAQGVGPVTIEVRLSGHTVFLTAMPGTSPVNADWARRKRNVVELLHRSSYAIGLASRRDDRSLLDVMGLSARDFADHGGSVPIIVDGVGVIGAVTVSGLPQREDHSLVIEVLAEMCGVPVTEIALA